MKDKWTQQFQGKLDGYEMAAPEMEWTELDKALAKNRRPAMAVVWGRRIAAAAAVALLVVGGARVLLPGAEAEKGGAPQQNCGERWLFLLRIYSGGSLCLYFVDEYIAQIAVGVE